MNEQKKMNYSQFKIEAAAKIKKYLPEEYQDYKVEIQPIVKSAVKYDALFVKPVNETITVAPSLNLSDAYDEYRNGKSFEAIMEDLAYIRTSVSISIPDFSKEDIVNYNWVKDKIYPRLINTGMSEDYLSNKPHKDIEDLSVIYTIRFNSDERSLASAAITNDLLELYGVDKETIHKQAMSNLAKEKPKFMNIADMLFNPNAKEKKIENINPEDYEVPFFFLSSQNGTCGSVMILNPKTMDAITKNFGDIYVIPSSVHEVLIVPQHVMPATLLAKMCTEINSKEVPDQDILSNNIYEYDAETHSLSIAEGIEEELDIDDDPDI